MCALRRAVRIAFAGAGTARRAGKPHLCGEVESVLRAFDCGQLRRDEFRMPGCWGQHLRGESAAIGVLLETASPVGRKHTHTHCMRLPMSESQPATIQNRQTMSERQALFLRFGYDSAASLKFILAKVLPLPGHRLEIGTGKGGLLAELGKHADHITTLDNDADQQRLAKRHVRQAGARCPIRYVIHDASGCLGRMAVSIRWPA